MCVWTHSEGRRVGIVYTADSITVRPGRCFWPNRCCSTLKSRSPHSDIRSRDSLFWKKCPGSSYDTVVANFRDRMTGGNLSLFDHRTGGADAGACHTLPETNLLVTFSTGMSARHFRKLRRALPATYASTKPSVLKLYFSTLYNGLLLWILLLGALYLKKIRFARRPWTLTRLARIESVERKRCTYGHPGR
jgi:hypothetical protein